MAASRAPDGDGFIALTTTSVLRVDSSGQFRVICGVAGFPLAQGTPRVSWRGTRSNSVALVGRDCLIGVEFGVIWLTWNAGARCFEEYWLVPPDIIVFLLEIRGVHQLSPPP